MKLIFVTGGVISGLGKGITAASIGRMLKSAGYTVTMAKMDPYLQIDAGTMSPYEHGETFVTTDGFETDLDLGHYERYINEELTKNSSITTGQVYQTVIAKERRGDYLGKTVQVIPHITNEIKQRVYTLATGADVTIIEIGGTVGDIEGPHFIEAMRQLRHDIGKENVLFVHVAPILTVSTSGEMKTKAIQHSIIKLREVGIQANILVCRTTKSLTQNMKSKLAMFCDIDENLIIEAVDQNIYQVPLSFQEQGLDRYIIKHFFDVDKKANMAMREQLVHKLTHPKKEIVIGLSGKYTDLDDAYISVIEALKHAGAFYDSKVTIEWIDTTKYQESNREKELEKLVTTKNIQGIISPGGFGDRGIEGMINIADYCRRKNIPYLGICLGLQVAVIAFARNICGIADAHSQEFCPDGVANVIAIMEGQKNISEKGGTMRLGSYDAVLVPNTKVRSLYKQFEQLDSSTNGVSERHRHRFEVQTKYHQILEEQGMIISGTSPDKQLVGFVEIKNHPFYVATQAHPEFKSRINTPHPLFLGLIGAIVKD